MSKQKGICEECKQEYEYEYNPKYPRKYCHECSAKKKAEFAGQQPDGDFIAPVPQKPGIQIGMPATPRPPKSKEYEKDPVGLAVEVFCAIMQDLHDKETRMNEIDVMKESINLVKQAREAFE